MADNDNQPETKIVSVTGKRCEVDTQSWYEYKWKEQQETPRRLEDAAKFLSGTISICLAPFFAVQERP
ncbi:hypothetical protein LCGC14_3098370 [marine sediment metagenome]|uniref:Uncharacterized protein n=1 Tax=marine sediment metagenome TaxID=412755 RepID=A0A0F8YFX2_9ZZZZ